MTSFAKAFEKPAHWLTVSLPLLATALYGLDADIHQARPQGPCGGNFTILNLTLHHDCSKANSFQMGMVVVYTTLVLMALLVGTSVLSAFFLVEHDTPTLDERNVLTRLGTLGFLLGAFVTGAQDTPGTIGALCILAVPRLLQIYRAFKQEEEGGTMCIPHLLMACTAVVATGVLTFEYKGEEEWAGASFGASIVALGCAYPLWPTMKDVTWMPAVLETVSLFGSTVLSILASQFFTSTEHEFIWIVVGATSLGLYASTISEKREGDNTFEGFKGEGAMKHIAYLVGALAVLGVYIGAYLDFGEVDWEKGGRPTSLLEHAMGVNVGIAFAYFFAILAAVMNEPTLNSGRTESVPGIVRVFSAIMLGIQVGGSVIHETHDAADMSTSEVVSIVLFAGLFLASSLYIEMQKKKDTSTRFIPMMAAGLAALVVIIGFIAAMNGDEADRIDYDPPEHAAQYTFMILTLVLSIVYAVHFPLRAMDTFAMIRYLTPFVEGTLLGLLAAYIGFDYLDDSAYRHLTTKIVLIAFVHVLLAIRLNTPFTLKGAEGAGPISFNFWDRYKV